MPKIAPLILLAMLVGCGAGDYQRPLGAELHQQCPETRTQVCTMEYAPVCAFVGKDQRKQYSNACSACGNAAVSGYISGPCPQGVK